MNFVMPTELPPVLCPEAFALKRTRDADNNDALSATKRMEAKAVRLRSIHILDNS